MTEVVKTEKENFILKIIKELPWKDILLKSYEGLRPHLEKKVLDTESKWDDMALASIDTLVAKFLK